jgi:hypothetical protein
VSQFTKLRGIGTYAGNVMTGRKALNLWRVLSNEHPVSGERTLVRQRKMINGSEVAAMEEVTPLPHASPESVASLLPEAFEPKPHIEKGPHGLYQFEATDETRPEGVSTTLPYPIHRDPDSLRRYVVLDARTDPPRRHYLDSEQAGYSPVPATGDAEIEGADEEFGGEFEDDTF